MKKIFKTTEQYGFLRAFSLVELLISLIIISLVIAAFAPVMSKKFTHNFGITTSKKYEDLLLTYGNFRKDDLYDCRVSDDETYTDCKFKVPDNVGELVAVLSGGGGGGAGGVAADIQTINVTTNKTEFVKTVEIKDGMANVIITDLIGAGAGGGAPYNETTYTKRYIKDCPDKTVPVYGNRGSQYCITKYNIRPNTINQYHNNYTSGEKLKETPTTAYGLEIPTEGMNLAKNDETVFYGTPDAPISVNPACWITPSVECSSGDEYPGCGRTVCNWAAASVMCAPLSLGDSTCSKNGSTNDNDTSAFNESCLGMWRLAGLDEFLNMSSYESALYRSFYGLDEIATKNAALFCDGYVQSPRCGITNFEYCLGSYDNKCYPSRIWSVESIDSTFVSEYYAYIASINNGGYHPWWGAYMNSGNRKINAASVRCILKAAEPQYCKSYSGGGGTSGTALTEMILIPDEIVKANIGAKIVLTAGVGGEGGGQADDAEIINDDNQLNDNEEGVDGLNGGYSQVTIQKGETIIWGYRVQGGFGGKHAILGQAGKQTDYETKCQKYDASTNQWKITACENAKGSKGNGGQISSDKPCALATIGGGGGKSGNSDGYGDGGSGGHGIRKNAVSKYPNYGKNGQPGLAAIKYTHILSPGAAGGGGGGACVARIEKIPVRSGIEFNIRIGAGGKGGKVENDGISGGATILEYPSRLKLTALGGAAGKTGKKGSNNNGNVVNPEYGASSELVDCEAVEDMFFENLKDNLVFRYQGKQGEAAKIDEVTTNSMGGNGGASGFSQISGFPYTQGGCGGYSNEGNCSNTYNYGLSSEAYNPFKLYSSKNYGSFGTGGGGGGWYNDLVNPQPAGSGGNGLDGYVYLYWVK